MSQPQPRPTMPGTLKAVRVILGVELVFFALVPLGFLPAIADVGTTGPARIWAEEKGALAYELFWTLHLFVMLGLQVYVVVRLKSGDRRVQTCLRLFIALSFIGIISNLVEGEGSWFSLVLYVIILFLAEGPAASEWFRMVQARDRAE